MIAMLTRWRYRVVAWLLRGTPWETVAVDLREYSDLQIAHLRGEAEHRAAGIEVMVRTLRADAERAAQDGRDYVTALVAKEGQALTIQARAYADELALQAHRHTGDMGEALRRYTTELVTQARAEAQAATEGLLAAARRHADTLSEQDRAYAEQLAERSREHAAALQRWAESRGLTLAVPMRGPRQFTYEDRQ